MKHFLYPAVAVLITGCSVFGIRTSEEPGFKVLFEHSQIQIRQYNEMLVAETEVSGDYEEASTAAFKRLAGYIFGKNSTQQSIAMTAPVVQENNSEKIAMTAPVLQQPSANKWIMSFVLPSQYTLETIPKPVDENITLKKISGKKVASLRYTGSLSEKKFRQKSDQLKSWLIEHGYSGLSEPRSAGYDPPWTIPILRKNEIHIDLL